ncbi:MAG: non-homologous end-joining DNA ligase [Saprospiraceae bacterium]|nr:non-homologous end-joining DNA ligase [Saprospiraceae bacterium]
MNKALKSILEKIPGKANNCSMPEWFDPMLATLTHHYFSDPDWIYERKLDGQRCLFYKHQEVRLMSRNRKIQNDYYPEIVEAIGNFPGTFILDGELVCFNGNLTSFQTLQNRMHVRHPSADLMDAYPVITYLFDVLYLDGFDLRQMPLRQRKEVLKSAFSFHDPVRFLIHRNGNGQALLTEACKKGWEGLVAKKAGGTYRGTRSGDWLKFKCNERQEFVIGGYTKPRGERIGFGALLIGYYDDDDLKFAGKVGTGFDDKFLRTFKGQLDQHQSKYCPFNNYPDADADITWVVPQFVGEVVFTEWTSSGKLRHPRFLGLRMDKKPAEVVRES